MQRSNFSSSPFNEKRAFSNSSSVVWSLPYMYLYSTTIKLPLTAVKQNKKEIEDDTNYYRFF